MKGMVQQHQLVVERSEEGDKDKKTTRRSWKPKHNPAVSGYSSQLLSFLLFALFRVQKYCQHQLTMAANLGSGLGVYYGRQTSNSPSAAQVVKMFKDNHYSKKWISEPNNELLPALNDQGIKVILGIPNSKIKGLSPDVYVANQWVKDNISSYPNVGFTHVCVGDLSNMSTEDGMDLFKAMENIHAALKRNHKIKMDSPLFIKVIPLKWTASLFQLRQTMTTSFSIPPLPFSLLIKTTPNTSFVFDAMVDGFFGDMKDLGFDNTKIVVASGWPRETKAGDTKATVQNAKTYNSNLKGHIQKSGTPKNKNRIIETFIWSAFDEDRMAGAHEGWKHLLLLDNELITVSGWTNSQDFGT
ncbi:glucan endo-1,3-beta-glucosidase [Cinnamomum micranthum f. kanehirae]|uniref:Glucan endo-1,3-beta-glucosidase n=1 Tax=Cinnamomum micranthum f. kanehirae TaxID=337451 RepID=A0A443N3H8_9MAGN|nr:glucan endo-1,3-beta-glucosidase [Cinnamomum micranthum f. kanehirae]